MHGKAKSPAEDVLATTSVSFNGSYTTPVGASAPNSLVGNSRTLVSGIGAAAAAIAEAEAIC